MHFTGRTSCRELAHSSHVVRCSLSQLLLAEESVLLEWPCRHGRIAPDDSKAYPHLVVAVHRRSSAHLAVQEVIGHSSQAIIPYITGTVPDPLV